MSETTPTTPNECNCMAVSDKCTCNSAPEELPGAAIEIAPSAPAALPEQQHQEGQSAPTEEEKDYEFHEITYVYGGKVRTDSVPVNPGLLKGLAKRNPTEEVLEVEEDENETAEEKEQRRNLLNALKESHLQCDMFLRATLAENADSKESVLHKALVQMEALGKNKPNSLYYARAKRSTAQGDDFGQWQPLQIFDMNLPSVAKAFPPTVVSAYRQLQPRENNLRLLVLDNVSYSGGVFIFHRMFVYFQRYAKPAEGQSYPRSNLHEKSILIAATTNGYKADLNKSDPQLAHLTAEQLEKIKDGYADKLTRAIEDHGKLRIKQRDHVLRCNLPKVISLIWSLFARVLIERIDNAKPNIPQRILLRVPVEQCGMLVDVDHNNIVMESELRDDLRVLEAKQQAAYVALSHFKTMKPSEFDAEQQARFDLISKDARYLMPLVNKMGVLLDAMEPVVPDREILLHIVDQGQFQDCGIAVDIVLRTQVPYAYLRKMLESITQQERAEAEAAELPELVPEAQ